MFSQFQLPLMRPLVIMILCFSAGYALNAQFQDSNLPILLIQTELQATITKEKISATLQVVDEPFQRNLVDGPYNGYNGLISIKGRGSSSWDLFEKKGYTFETRLPTGENNNVSLLGLPAENDWVLHGPYADKTLMKNALVYSIGSEMGNYAPRHRFCELVLNDEYRGVYLLVERIKRDKNRVDIATLSPDDNSGDELTGGYIMRIDRDEGDGFAWKADFGYDLSYFNYYAPDPEDMSQIQRDYIKNYVVNFENSLRNRAFDDLNEGYRAYINVPSFIDYFIISEWTKNIDAYRLSTYFYKDKDSKGGKLTMGPIWDFNLSCGGVNIGFGDWGAKPENWIADELPGGVPFWWKKLLEDPYFNACLQQRWLQLRTGILHEDSVYKRIDEYSSLLDEAKDRNFEIFPLQEAVWGNNHSGLTYAEEIDRLKSFLTDRMIWMDGAIGRLSSTAQCLECFGNCDPEVLNFSHESERLYLYPNPTMNEVILVIPGSYTVPFTVLIHDQSGRLINTNLITDISLDDRWTLDLSFLQTKGVYTYSVYNSTELIGVGKFILHRN